jgi:ribosomal protein L2
MALIKFKPTSPGRRGMSGYDFEEITKTHPKRRWSRHAKKDGRRNNRERYYYSPSGRWYQTNAAQGGL